MRPSGAAYRPDIDGLRALAVLAVVAYHAAPGAVPGGFVGVDVFSVISGYLITGIIQRGIEAGTFSYREFYARRVRRIFPALVIVLASTLALGHVLLLPDELDQLWQHTAAGAAFLSNFQLWSETGYFDTSAATKPLLHLWSLGIEEQFYALWPLVLVLLGLRWAPLIAAVSLGLCLYLTLDSPSLAFYMPFTRLWELVAGALLVYRPLRLPRHAGLLGLALIFGSIALLDAKSPFPGWRAALPVAGAILVIASPVRLLGAAPLAYLGRISYPLYLWHWPLLVFVALQGNAPLMRAAAVLAALGASMLTYRLVETPIQRAPAVRVAWSLVGSMFILVAAAHLLAPPPPPTLAVAAAPASLCGTRYALPQRLGWFNCGVSGTTDPSVFIAGDSHAHHLFDGLASALRPRTVLSLGSCPPMRGAAYTADGKPPEHPCVGDRMEEEKRLIRDQVIVGTPSVKYAIAAGNWWSFDAAGQQIDPVTLQPVALSMVSDGRLPIVQYVAAIERGLLEFEAAGYQVAFVLDTPRLPYSGRECLARPGKEPESCETSLAYQLERQAPFRLAVMAMLAAHPKVRIFDPLPVFCDAARCRMAHGAEVLLSDTDHLTPAGSLRVARVFSKWADANLPGLVSRLPD